ncbi:lysozyme [Erwinia phage AH03]|uniref:Lysozyme n=1 Tax=Erwinia phage AH03 TaxID=2869568 RepID=A0AAE8BUF8_9CAUD|nr:lysozyme [Erwinia phage AH03]
MSQIAKMLRVDEGFKSVPYRDTEGYPTIGIGQRIGPKNALMTNYTLTISQPVADLWMQDIALDYMNKIQSDSRISAALTKCNDARRDALLDMAYQLGVSGLSGFRNTLVLISNGDFAKASAEMLNSLWARQTPQRAKRLSETIRLGDYSAYEKMW